MVRLGMCGPKGCVLQTEVCREAATAGNCSQGPAYSGHKQGAWGAGGRVWREEGRRGRWRPVWSWQGDCKDLGGIMVSTSGLIPGQLGGPHFCESVPFSLKWESNSISPGRAEHRTHPELLTTGARWPRWTWWSACCSPGT